jgi:hypothetical protein
MLFVLSCFALALAAALHFGNVGGDAFFCLAEGREALAGRWLFDDDAFVAGAVGPVLNHFPLYSVVLAALEHHAGIPALQLCSAVVSAATLTAAVVTTSRRVEVRVVAAALLVVLAFVDAELFEVRAQVVATAFFVCLVNAVRRLVRARPVSLKSGMLLGALWINVHPSAPIGFVFPICAGGLVLLAERSARRNARNLLVWAGTVLLGEALTPYGPALLLDDLRMMSMKGTQLIALFRPPTVNLAFVVCFVALLLVATRAAARARGHGLVDSVLLLGLVLASLRSRRFLELAVLWALPMAGPMIAVAMARVRRTRAWHPQGLRAGGVAFAVASFGASIWLAANPWHPASTQPIVVAPCVSALGRPRVLALWGWGGYLDWSWRGAPRPLVDGRTQLYPESLIADYAHLENAGPEVDALLDIYGIDVVMMPDAVPLAQHLTTHPRWREQCRDGVFASWSRRAGRTDYSCGHLR